jgi:hypothetical protein
VAREDRVSMTQELAQSTWDALLRDAV